MISHLLSKLPVPRPADWGFGMTVCIAAIPREQHIVSVSDQKVSLHQFSGDNLTLKSYVVTNQGPWVCMAAGADITSAEQIVDQVSLKFLTSPGILLRDITAAFTTAYQEYLMGRASALYLKRFGMDMTSFRESGRKKLGPDVFDTLCDKIARVSLDLKFLVYGFDCVGIPHVFVISNPGIEEVYDKPGFWAIGSGAMSALSMLFYRQQSKIVRLKTTIYNVVEAKFMAESATDVGEQTFVSILSKPGTKIDYPVELTDEIRAAWSKKGAPRVPPRIVTRIASKVSVRKLTKKEKTRLTAGDLNFKPFTQS